MRTDTSSASIKQCPSAGVRHHICLFSNGRSWIRRRSCFGTMSSTLAAETRPTCWRFGACMVLIVRCEPHGGRAWCWPASVRALIAGLKRRAPTHSDHCQSYATVWVCFRDRFVRITMGKRIAGQHFIDLLPAINYRAGTPWTTVPRFTLSDDDWRRPLVPGHRRKRTAFFPISGG